MKKNPKDFFQSISEFSHHIGVYLTYTLDKEVIEKISEVSSGTKLILHDFRQGISIDDNVNSTIFCIPMKPLKSNEKNCFHSKFALLKSAVGAKFIVGSANLSVDSFTTEKEIAIEIELEFKNETDVYIYNEILNFLSQLIENKQLITGNTALKQTLDKLSHSELPNKKGDITFIYNSKEKSIFDEYKDYLNKHRSSEKAERIKVATPFVSDEYSKIEEVRGITNNISVYLRTGAKIKPFQKYQCKIFQPLNRKRAGFHSKMMLTEFYSYAVLFIGSANFTEQGFFKTLNESANQECGIILKVQIDEMQDWFGQQYWKQLSDNEIANYEEAVDNSLEFYDSQNNHYAWAEKNNTKITTYIFNPNNLPVRRTKNGSIIKLKITDGEFLFITTELKEQNQKVNFFIGDEKISLSVFELTDYISGLNEKGESIFESFKGIYSVNSKELDAAINEGNLSISENTNIKITEPPKLEQFFYNVKYLMQSINNKKYFTDFNVSEIKNEINKIDDGRTIYLTLQLFKAFSTKPNTETIKQECAKRINELAEKLNIDKKTLNIFIKGWLTSKI